MVWTDDGQPIDGAAGEFGLAFERALSDTIARSIPVNDSSSTEEAEPNHSDDVTAGVIAVKQDASVADQRQPSAESE